MGPKTKSAHLLRWHYGDRVTMGQFSNSFPKHFSYLCEYAIRFDLSCSFCEYPFIFHCLHCSPSWFDPNCLLLAYLWLGLSWVDCISANKSFSSSKTSSRKPYTSSKQHERHKHSVEITINFSQGVFVFAQIEKKQLFRTGVIEYTCCTMCPSFPLSTLEKWLCQILGEIDIFNVAAVIQKTISYSTNGLWGCL